MTRTQVFDHPRHADIVGLHHHAAVWTSSSIGVVRGERRHSGPSSDMRRQAVRAYDRLLALLEVAGLEPQDVVRLVEVVTVDGLPEYDEAASVRTTAFGGLQPSVTTTVVQRLASREALLEVQIHAMRGGSPSRIESQLVGTEATFTTSGVAEGHDGAVFLPTLTAVDSKGEVVHAGDFVGQYAYCLERAELLLRLAGLSLDAAVTTYDYSTPATRDVYRRSHHVRKDRLGGAGVYPGAGGILMSQLHQPGVLVAIDVTASRHPLEVVNPGWDRYDTLTYSPGVRAGHTLYTSGFAALDMATQQPLFTGDLLAQTQATYASLVALLEHAGLDKTHVLEASEYYTAASGFPAGENRAASAHPLRGLAARRSTFACQGLLRSEFLLEVFATAVFPGDCS